MRIHFQDQPPNFWQKTHRDHDDESRKLAEAKLQKVLDRRYMDLDAAVKSLMTFFYVPKGEDDI